MDDQQSEAIKKELEFLETDDLLDIWQKHDLEQWTEEAFDAIRKILLERNVEIPPGDNIPEAKEHLKQAENFLEAEDHYKALSQCNMAIHLAPHYGYAYYIKGLIYDELDKLEEAVQFYKEALQLDPNLKEAKQNLNWALNDLDKEKTKPEERILAALSHVSILLFAVGLLIPVYIWITQKEKSRYVAFQSLQAIAFQLLTITLQFLTVMISYANTISSSLGSALSASILSGFSTALAIFAILHVLFFIGGFCGAITAFRGKPFKYVWIGNLVAKYVREQ